MVVLADAHHQVTVVLEVGLKIPATGYESAVNEKKLLRLGAVAGVYRQWCPLRVASRLPADAGIVRLDGRAPDDTGLGGVDDGKKVAGACAMSGAVICLCNDLSAALLNRRPQRRRPTREGVAANLYGQRRPMAVDAVLIAPALAARQDAAAGAALGVPAGPGVAPAVGRAVEAPGHDRPRGDAHVVFRVVAAGLAKVVDEIPGGGGAQSTCWQV